MNQNRHSKTKLTKGFTLLELAFSLAIIATLVAILLPKGVDALRNSRVQQVAKTVDTLKTATTIKGGHTKAKTAIDQASAHLDNLVCDLTDTLNELEAEITGRE